ncbi:hypothetical protein TNCV_235341 [Trichonephila clavipes]|uniref:Uncharacterized protein n=1 Tax=Trichonephila clavipes TaxID=2585209 RepID=A0A8X6SJN9_TRICX|nr:hypothetical protein TNCV_235341 [Trichonephila clavipes]
MVSPKAVYKLGGSRVGGYPPHLRLNQLNRRDAVRSYGERYPTRRQMNQQTLSQVNQNLAEHASFRAMIKVTGLPRTSRTPVFEEDVLRSADRNSGTSLRALVTERSGTSAHRARAYMPKTAILNPS